jgi:hypothetical protein
MSVELLYTSAEQGLKQGSRGFCTVISTAGMPLNLANRLESLSGYRHIYPPNSEESGRNPVAYSHLRLSVGGRVVSVISRVADYGLDYSQRTNKIAHHVVLDSSELSKAGPAWLMEQPGVFRSQWDGHCRTPGSGPVIPLGDRAPAVCRRWYSVVGDAGWAGVLADNLSSSNSKPIWIVFSIDQSAHLLPMLNEAISLLPVPQRWQVTFSTYATTIPPDIDCRVRCVLEGSNEARLAPARGPVIDLTKPLPLAPSAPLVILAREGPKLESTVVRPTILPASLDGTGELGEHVDLVSKATAFQFASGKTKSAMNQADVEDFVIEHDDELELLRLKPRSAKPPPPPQRLDSRSAKNSGNVKYHKKSILALASAAVLFSVTAMSYWVLTKNADRAGTELSATNSNKNSKTDPNPVSEENSASNPEDSKNSSQIGETEFAGVTESRRDSQKPSDKASEPSDIPSHNENGPISDPVAQVEDKEVQPPGIPLNLNGRLEEQGGSKQETPESEFGKVENLGGEPPKYTDGIVLSITPRPNWNTLEVSLQGYIELMVEGELYFCEVWNNEHSYTSFKDRQPSPNKTLADGWAVHTISWNAEQSSRLQVGVRSILVNPAKLNGLRKLVRNWNDYLQSKGLSKSNVIALNSTADLVLLRATSISTELEREIEENKRIPGATPAIPSNMQKIKLLEKLQEKIIEIKNRAAEIVDDYWLAFKSRTSAEIELSTGINLSISTVNGWQPQPLVLKLDLANLNDSDFKKPNSPEPKDRVSQNSTDEK